jgi:predicted transposase YbfD/YdcC
MGKGTIPMDKATPLGNIEQYFGNLTDPRVDRTKRHKLLDIIVITICGVICGADDWVNIEMFGKAKLEWLKTFLELPNGIPSHDTFGRVFAALNPQEFENSFMEWVRAIFELTKGQVIAIDGKQVRGSLDKNRGKRAIYMVNAWASANQLVLGQLKVDEKSNEITAIPALLELLEISGCIVTIDAIGTQTGIAEIILERGGDYLLAVKENQPNLKEDMEYIFGLDRETNFADAPYQHAKMISKGHGRIEIRQCWCISDPEYLLTIRERKRFPGLKTLVMIENERRIGEKVELQTQFYITSLESNAKKILQAKRSHWEIENSVHWVLDIAFNEDHNRVHKDNGPENLAIIRKMALNLLKQEKTLKIGIKGKRLRCGWDKDYLLKVLSA